MVHSIYNPPSHALSPLFFLMAVLCVYIDILSSPHIDEVMGCFQLFLLFSNNAVLNILKHTFVYLYQYFCRINF